MEENHLVEECQEAQACWTPIFVQCAQVYLGTSTFCEVKLDVCKGGQAGLCLIK